ncbi:MAG: TlpA disulfide reductase family protein [Sulfurovaceae bacterium]|nr:TlpA disulfide reductase family protein [Sulfurovaceae bacterium]MDD5548562.1 TlpA disulfide reductase family protein [Sulfurovaceae bacterium]
MKKILFLIASVFIILNVAQAKPTENYTFTDTSGKIFHAQGTKDGLIIPEAKGKIIFLEFFGHKCPPCITSIPHYKNLQKKYNGKIQIIAIEVQGLDNNQVKTFAAQKGINYTTVSQDKAGDFVNYIASRANWSGAIPYLVVIDKKGVVQFMQAGSMGEAGLETIIKELSK